MEGRPMVSSSTGAMNSLLDKLPELESMRQDLESLRNNVLEKFAGRGVIRGAKIKEWMEQVRKVVYDMEDWIDLCIRPSNPDKPEPATNFGWSDDIAEQIEEFKAQIQEAQDRCTRYGLLDKVPASDADLADPGVPRKVTMDPKLLHGEEPGLVALDDPTEQLVNLLIGGEKELKVVSVLGMGGLGKTTLAKEVYRKLLWRYECRVFVYVGRNPSIKTTLINILHQVIPRLQGETESWDEQRIVAELWEFLSSKRYFIVLDDIWTIRDWKVISCAFLDNDLGSRILTTTCIMDVAKSCSLHPSDVIYRMETLSENYSRRLFRSRISVEEKERPADFTEVADDMLRMCGGMPLAIIVTASLLDRKSAELGPSRKLQESIYSALDQYSTSQGIRKLLDMSYADLSLPLKSCFLYLSAFPENYTIKKDCSIRIWIAEGFIPKRDEESLWETGESYFNELISRRLIQPVFDYDDGQAVGCTVHGVILDYISSLSSEDNFVTTGAELRSGPFPHDTIRRFSFDCSNKDEDDTLASSTVHLSRVRSLIFFGDVKGMPVEILHLRFLRVLDLEDAYYLGSHHLEGIEGLVLLRYLGLRGTGIDELPEKIGELQHLETLDLRRTRMRILPASTVGMRKLVCLLLSGPVQAPKEIWKMQELEEVSTIDARSIISLNSVSELLIKSKRLRMLGVRCHIYSDETTTYRRSVKSLLNEHGKSSLQFLEGRPALLHHLRRFELTISGTVRRVPHMMASLVNLTHLRIKIGCVEAEDLRVLGDLPNLILLDLHSKYSGIERLIISRDGFRCLVVFSYTCPWMGLQFTPRAMPQLRRLRFELGARETGSRYGDFDFGIQHLSCLTRVHATIHCWGARDLESADAAIREQVSKNPNSPVLEWKREENENLQESYKIRYIPTETTEFDTGAIGSLLPKLGELLKEEYKLHKGVRAQVESLSRELETMHTALRKVAQVPHEQLDKLVKLWARDVRKLSYDIEDVIDTFMMHMVDGREIANRIKYLNNQLQVLANSRGRYTDNDIVATPAATSTIDPHLLAMYKDAAQLVGIDGPRDTLIKKLFDEDDASNKKMKIVTIVGFGGLGKTTLAKAVYDKLKAGFDCWAFVRIGHYPDMKKVFKDILIGLDKQKYMNLNMTMLDERQLIDELREFLENKRYLVVIDDIWDISVWKIIIRCAFPDNKLENRIIATTRMLDVAVQLGGAYKLQPLSDAYSKKLFYGRVFGGECLDNQLREVSDKILRKCGGVPLAIVMIASLLNSKMQNTREWNKVHDSIGCGLFNDPDMKDLRMILSLSYYSLPPHLRTCLLYMSIFPADYKIKKDRLIWLWIAEGFIQYGEQWETLYELGEYYFNELINRSLIQPGDIGFDGRVEACRVHDMVLDLIRSLSNEENFVTVLDGAEQNTSSHRNVRRLSIQNTSKVTASLDAMRMPQTLRSLTVFSNPAINLVLPPSRFRSLRVLELGGCDVGEARHLNLGNLLHLRYLGLRETGIQQLPGDIGKLQFLQTLDLRGNDIQELPATLVQLRQLMCLRVDPCTRLPDGMGNLASLEVLWGIIANESPEFVEELRKLTGLRELEIGLAEYGTDGDSLQVDLAESLRNLPKIHTLVIRAFEGCLDRFGERWMPPQRLVCFWFIGSGFFSRMPACIERNPTHLSDLSSLSIHVKRLRQEEDMQILARLPALCSLLITGDAGGRLIIGADGFHCLRKFTCLHETPMFQQGAMPRVESVLFTLHVHKTKDGGNDGFETGLGNLLSLEDVVVYLQCGGARAGEVKEAEAALRHAADVNPNSPTLQIRRLG